MKRIAALLLFSSLLIHSGCGMGQCCQCVCEPCCTAYTEPSCSPYSEPYSEPPAELSDLSPQSDVADEFAGAPELPQLLEDEAKEHPMRIPIQHQESYEGLVR